MLVKEADPHQPTAQELLLRTHRSSVGLTCLHCTAAYKGKVRPIKELDENSRFMPTFAVVGSSGGLTMSAFTGTKESTCRLQGVGQQMKEVDVARELKVEKVCGSNFDLRPGVFIGLHHTEWCTLPAQHESHFHIRIWRRALLSLPRNIIHS